MNPLKLLYGYWMRFAKLLGRIQATIILFFIYFIGVGIISMISFVFRKDFLDKRLVDEMSFWRKRDSSLPTFENSKRQF